MWFIFGGEQYGQSSCAAEKVLNSEGIKIGIVSWLVRGCHKIDRITGGGQEEELEYGIICAVGKRPEEV